MDSWISEILRQGGYFGIVFLMFLENVFPPIPSELIMPMAGFLVSDGELNYFYTTLAGTLGAVLGTLPLYYLGFAFGPEKLKNFCDAYGHWMGIKNEDIEKSQKWFERYGVLTVFFMRLVPGLRSLVSVPAGIIRMPLLQYLLFTFAGSFLWTAILVYVGQSLGRNFELTKEYLGPASSIILGLCLALYLWKLGHHYLKQARARR